MNIKETKTQKILRTKKSLNEKDMIEIKASGKPYLLLLYEISYLIIFS